MSALLTTMRAIADASRRSGEVVNVIESIAFQTNILAINAAIEAAAAGEKGRGFSMLAGEVRKLSQRCSESARQIAELVESNVQKANHGLRDVGAAEGAIRQTVEANRRLATLLGELSKSSGRQAKWLTQVATAVRQVESGAQRSAAMVEQSAASAQGLGQLTETLNRTVEQFQL